MFGWLGGDPSGAAAMGPAWAPMATGTLDWESLLALLQANVPSTGGFAARPQTGYRPPMLSGNGGFQGFNFQPITPPANDYSSGGGGMGGMMGKGGGQTRGSTGGVSLSDAVRSRG